MKKKEIIRKIRPAKILSQKSGQELSGWGKPGLKKIFSIFFLKFLEIYKKYQQFYVILMLVLFLAVYVSVIGVFIFSSPKVCGKYFIIYRAKLATVNGIYQISSWENNSISGPFAVMIDNHEASRPAWGLDQAKVVYEVPAEGGITRYMAFFDNDSNAAKIGPVRSIRPYFIDLAHEYNAVIFHSGGSPEALKILKTSPVVNVNEISGDGIYFRRDESRDRPHNLYTSGELIAKALENKIKSINLITDFKPWLYKDDIPLEERPTDVLVLEVDYSYPAYKASYSYDRFSNKYLRNLGEQIQLTAEGNKIWVKNIIIQRIGSKILDQEGRLDLTLDGQGNSEVYLDGKTINGYWRRSDGRTRFFDDSDNEIKFNRGSIWVEIILEDTGIHHLDVKGKEIY